MGSTNVAPQALPLYAAAGFQVTRVTPLRDNFGTSIVEGVKR